MKKRQRGDDDDDRELIMAAVMEVIKKKKEATNEKPQTLLTIDDKVPISVIVDRYNDILKEVICEEGIEPNTEANDDSIIEFTGVIAAPNEVDYFQINPRLMAVDGTCDTFYEAIPDKVGEMKVTIIYTRNTADKLQYRKQRQQEEIMRRKTASVMDKNTMDELEMLKDSLECNLPIDTKFPSTRTTRKVSTSMEIICVTVGLKGQCRSNGLALLAAAQGDNLRSMKVFPDPRNAIICLTAEISRVILPQSTTKQLATTTPATNPSDQVA
jgi:hypothetical protein